MKKTIEAQGAMTAEERAFIERFTAERCRPHDEVVASLRRAEMRRAAAAALAFRADCAAVPLAAGTETGFAGGVKSPGEEVRFHFAADAADGEAPSWRVEVAVPPGASAGTPLEISARLADGRPVAAAVLKIAGASLRVDDGVASMAFGDFTAGMEDTDVSLTVPGGAPVPGALVFL